MSNDDKRERLAPYAEYLPIEEQAAHGVLPDRLTIAEIASLHPNGEDFAVLLLNGWFVYLHRSGQGFALGDPPAGKFGNGLPGELTDIFAEAALSVPEFAQISVEDHAEIVQVHRDDLQRWLEEIKYWPLAEDALLNKWWPPEERGAADNESSSENVMEEQQASDHDSKGPVFQERKQALERFLTEQGIPREDWHHLKTRHHYSRRSLYDSLASYHAFKNQHGHGGPISISTFTRKFWIEQNIAELR